MLHLYTHFTKQIHISKRLKHRLMLLQNWHDAHTQTTAKNNWHILGSRVVLGTALRATPTTYLICHEELRVRNLQKGNIREGREGKFPAVQSHMFRPRMTPTLTIPFLYTHATPYIGSYTCHVGACFLSNSLRSNTRKYISPITRIPNPFSTRVHIYIYIYIGARPAEHAMYKTWETSYFWRFLELKHHNTTEKDSKNNL